MMRRNGTPAPGEKGAPPAGGPVRQFAGRTWTDGGRSATLPTRPGPALDRRGRRGSGSAG